ncbi:MAG: hypothetical protein E4H20_02860 [Spirochaetales bacterium]|nr:MAG: hypothetical protein E4H20_02860 [Spirochaetales bacterium]
MASAPIGRAKPAAQAVIATSLGGHDRLLTLNPLDIVLPEDFELGPLMPVGGDAPELEPVRRLTQALLTNTLARDAFVPSAADVTVALYGEALASVQEIKEIRLSRFQPSGGGMFAELRLVGETFRAGAGILVGQQTDGAWKLEYMELDLAGLERIYARDEPWDPYRDRSF